MLLFRSRANQISTNVKTNQTTNRIAVTTRFLRQYSWCFCVSSNPASPRKRNQLALLTRGSTEPTGKSTGLLGPDAYTILTIEQIRSNLPHCTNATRCDAILRSERGKPG